MKKIVLGTIGGFVAALICTGGAAATDTRTLSEFLMACGRDSRACHGNLEDYLRAARDQGFVCPPPPRAQWTYDADRDGIRRHGRDDHIGRDRHDDHDRYWRPRWPQPPINPPRYRDLTQERDIRDQHRAATKNGGQTGQ